MESALAPPEPDAEQPGRPFPAAAVAALLTAAVAALIAAALLRGPWLDEFWSLALADGGIQPSRWLADPHPLLPNLLYAAVRAAGPESLVLARLLLNLPALLLLIGTAWLVARGPARNGGFALLLVALIVALAPFATAFTELRSYAWQYCTAGAVVLLIHHLLAGDGLDDRRPAMRWAGAAAVFLALNLHFVGSIAISVAIALLLGRIAAARAGAWLWSIGGAALLGWTALIVQALFQYPRIDAALDVSWIRTSAIGVLVMLATAAGWVILANPPAAWLAVRQSHPSVGDRAFIRLVVAALALSALLLLLANAVRPLLADRYLASWQALFAGLVAATSWRAVLATRMRTWLTAIAATIAVAASSFLQSRDPGWNATRDILAAAARECPSASIYAMNPWRVAAPGSRTGRREGAVYALGYRRLAREGGFEVRMLPDTMRRLPVPGPCPTLLWVEMAGPDVSPEEVLRRAGLAVPPGVRIAILKGRSGFVLVARPAEALAPRRVLG